MIEELPKFTYFRFKRWLERHPNKQYSSVYQVYSVFSSDKLTDEAFYQSYLSKFIIPKGFRYRMSLFPFKSDQMLFLRLLASSFAVSWNFTWEYCLETKDMNSIIIPDLEFSVKSSKGYAKRTVCMLKPAQINYLYFVLLSEIWSQQIFIEMANIGDFILDPEGKNVKDIKYLRKQRLTYFNQQISNTTFAIQGYSLLYPSKNDSEDDIIISEDDTTRLL